MVGESVGVGIGTVKPGAKIADFVALRSIPGRRHWIGDYFGDLMSERVRCAVGIHIVIR
jgi:hypothetical protein